MGGRYQVRKAMQRRRRTGGAGYRSLTFQELTAGRALLSAPATISEAKIIICSIMETKINDKTLALLLTFSNSIPLPLPPLTSTKHVINVYLERLSVTLYDY